MSKDKTIQIKAKLKAAIYKSDKGDFGIYSFSYADKADIGNDPNKRGEFIGKGIVNPISVGSVYALEGTFKLYKKRDEYQLDIKKCEMTGDLTRNGVISLLKEAPGIGKKIAGKIVDQLGPNCLDLISDDHKLLVTTCGIPLNRAIKVTEWAVKEKRNSKFKRFLYSLNLTGFQVRKCIEKFDGMSKGAMIDNWYKLIEIDGVGFLTACKVADKLGVAAMDSNRVQEGIKYAIRSLMQNGSICIAWRDISKEACKLLMVPESKVIDQMKVLNEKGDILKDSCDRECTRVDEILTCKPHDESKSVDATLSDDEIDDLNMSLAGDVNENNEWIRAKTYNVIAKGKCLHCNRVKQLRFTYNPSGDDLLICEECAAVHEASLNSD